MNRLIVIVLCLWSLAATAQLQGIPPITLRQYGSTPLTGIHLLTNTKDFGFVLNRLRPPAYLTTVQLIDAGRPFPPVIYQAGTYHVDSSQHVPAAAMDFYTTADLQPDGRLSFVCHSVVHDTVAHLMAALSFDTAMLSLQGSDHIPSLDGHDYRVDSTGQVLCAVSVLDTMDISCLSGTAGDTGVVQTQRILIRDAAGQVVFSWDPFTSGDYSVCEMRYYNAAQAPFTTLDPLDWSHFNSARWAADGNIIVSFREVGCFKIDVHTGHIRWKLGGRDTVAIPVPDSLMYFEQHDFVQLPDGRYTVYSDGDAAHTFMAGQVYVVDEAAHTARLAERYRSSGAGFSAAMGSFRYHQDLRFVCYGLYQSLGQLLAPPDRFCDVFDSAGHVVAALVTPYDQIPYRAIPVDWSPEHLRPQIGTQGMGLGIHLPAGQVYTDIRWYDLLGDSAAVPVDSGAVLTVPVAGHTYVADAYINATGAHSWRITAVPYTYLPTGVTGVSAGGCLIYPNPAQGHFCIRNNSVPAAGVLYDAIGREVSHISILTGDNVYPTPAAKGIYTITSGEGSTYKLVVE